MATSFNPPAAQGEQTALSQDSYRFLHDYIHRESGIFLGDDKTYLIHARLKPVLAAEKLASLEELCLRLRSNPGEALRRRIVEAMTTHETLFFRDFEVFEMLRKHLLPELIGRKQATRSLRIWSAACSSGQEPYSLAMMLLELGLGDWNVEILGTDLSTQILERARSGRYLQIEMNRGLPASLLVKHFQRAGLDWQVKENVRKLTRFAPFDLRANMAPLGYFDLVLCRNVLIYFDMDLRRQILSGIRTQLYPDGYLILGSSECGFTPEGAFDRKTFDRSVVYQKTGAGGLR